ncbi:helix-turn-helix- domain containing protein AraC type [Parvibaculum lavamentivorans DS-1]|uniref:Helix-turn-helix-domain containing protein AraC type n=1 Tax=Parvibaculum lavamentivorans (strain DS-1 / DSM 13023 / NCIMB 13966) TaxID=402881 RepID=A7HQF7_PARL1|nr:AraC family transcriptional regulator [Parvibaculum lavamentivorans]ABS62140.1 helix-turn-helix- domain containing protein AraC type [Parvibaculum lavamentivorans DS-1]
MHMHIATEPSSAPQRSLTAVLAGLLEDADKVIDTDRQAARAFITRAAGLLQVEAAPAADERKPRSSGGLAPWQMRRVVAHIDASLPALVPLGDIAAIARLSPGYFSRAFKVSFGVTPQTYILRRRIERAQEMMLASSLPLAVIAVDCGFCDQAHFCRLFRRHAGTSPGTWRRTRQLAQAA